MQNELNGKFLATFEAATFESFLTAGATHATSKAMNTSSCSLFGLVGSCGHLGIFDCW